MNVGSEIVGQMSRYMPETMARGILHYALRKNNITESELGNELTSNMISTLLKGIDLFVDEPDNCIMCKERLLTLSGKKAMPQDDVAVMVEIRHENDIVVARNHAKAIGESVGFSKADQVKIATAVSELSRNIVRYAGSGEIRISTMDAVGTRAIRIVASDRGPGIRDLDKIMAGQYRSKTGLGLGLLGCKRLMDEFGVETKPGQGTKITIRKFLEL